jgi:hypothetical protein
LGSGGVTVPGASAPDLDVRGEVDQPGQQSGEERGGRRVVAAQQLAARAPLLSVDRGAFVHRDAGQRRCAREALLGEEPLHLDAGGLAAVLIGPGLDRHRAPVGEAQAEHVGHVGRAVQQLDRFVAEVVAAPRRHPSGKVHRATLPHTLKRTCFNMDRDTVDHDRRSGFSTI